MTAPKTKPSGKKVSEIDGEHRSWALSQPAVGGCLFCPEFRPEGTGDDIRAANEAHLQSVHPELVGKKRKRRLRANPAVIAFRQSLTDEESNAVDEERRRRMFQLGIEAEPARKLA